MDAPGEKLLQRFWETVAEKGVGGLLRPWQIRRTGRARIDVRREDRLALAQASADAEEIRSGRKRFTAEHQLVEVVPEGETSAGESAALRDFASAAQQNLLLERMRGDVNVAKAVLDAEAELENDPEPPPEQTVDDDWFTRWRDSASKVSSERLQMLWGKVLAGEVKSPGTFSLRTLEFLKTLSQEEAAQIEMLAPLVMSYDMVLGDDSTLEESAGIPLQTLVELQDLGIISQGDPRAVEISVPRKGRVLGFHGRRLYIVPPLGERSNITLASRSLTSLGKQVLKLGSFEADEEYLVKIGRQIKGQGFKVTMFRYKRLPNGDVQDFDGESL